MSATSLERRLVVYPTPRNFKIAIAYAATKSFPKAKALDRILGKFIDDNLSLHQQKELLNFFNQMTDEEKKNPAKYYENREKKKSVEFEMKNGRMRARPKIW